MTYNTCRQVILNKRDRLADEDWTAFVADMRDKMDIFLLNNRITDEEYNNLSRLLAPVEG